MLTLNQIVKKLRQIQNDHAQLNSFYFGDSPEEEASGYLRYPLMGATLQPGSLAKGVESTKMILWFAALVSKGEQDETEVLSDMNQVAKDVFAQFWQYLNENGMVLVTDAPFSSFTEKWDSEVSGWQIEVNMNQFYSRDTCQVPVIDSFLLVENGGFLLLENNAKIIL